MEHIDIHDAIKALSGRGWGSWWYFKLSLLQTGKGQVAAFGRKTADIEVPGKFETGKKLNGEYFAIYPLEFSFENAKWSQSAAVWLDREITVQLTQLMINNVYSDEIGQSPSAMAWLPFLAAKSKDGKSTHPFTFVFYKDNQAHKAILHLSFSGLPPTPEPLP